MTAQAIADAALASDREARRARARGDTATADARDRETQQILSAL